MTTTCKSKSSRSTLIIVIMTIVKGNKKKKILGNLKARAAGADITEADRR